MKIETFDKPFRHTIIDDFIPPRVVDSINAQWPETSAAWTKEDGSFNRKWSLSTVSGDAEKLVRFVDWNLALIQQTTGIAELFPDPERFGGGLHCIPRGGFLNMHVDFNQHPNGWHRRVNVLVYLNKEWRDEWGGHLQLGNGDDHVKIAPIGGRCVIFVTDENSWHGHPEPLDCPAHVQRRSMALYYYTKDPPPTAAHSTIYKRAKRMALQ